MLSDFYVDAMSSYTSLLSSATNSSSPPLSILQQSAEVINSKAIQLATEVTETAQTMEEIYVGYVKEILEVAMETSSETIREARDKMMGKVGGMELDEVRRL